MAEDRFHFIIPPENIRSEKYSKQGRSKTYPRDDYPAHGVKLKKETAQVRKELILKKDYELASDIFLQIEAAAKNAIRNYKSNLDHLGFRMVNSYNEKSNIAVVRISKRKFAELDEKLDEYIQTPTNKRKDYFSVIEAFSSIPPERKFRSEGKFSSQKNLSVIFNLYNDISLREKFAINQSIVNELLKYNKDVSRSNFVNGTTSIVCTLPENVIPIIANEFGSIKEASLSKTAFVEATQQINELPKELKILKPKSNSQVCIIDSGVNNASGIFDDILSESLPNLPKGSVDGHYEHGTFVASRCVFGDDIDNCLGTFILAPYCKIVDVQIFGSDSSGQKVNPSDYYFRHVIEKIVIKLHKTVKVYNLSLGFEHSINDYRISDEAKLLDFLSRKYKVLFVIASGNISSLLGKFPTKHFSNPLARIGSPAEAILSLTVGATSRYEDKNSLSKIGELSPFSKIGPGADLGIKPELVAHGGNLSSKYTRSSNLSAYGLSICGKRLATGVGTSLSAPLISQLAQKLFDSYPGSDPNLIKALLCHFTLIKNFPGDDRNRKFYHTGFGEPMIESAIRAERNNAAFVVEGKLDQDNYQRIKFHIPKSLSTSNRNSKLKVRITIVYDPPVSTDNDAEYSKSRLTISLNKLTDDGDKSIAFSGENDYHIPWNPVIKVEKTFTRNYITGPWELKLRLYTRGIASNKFTQDYAAVIEVIDEKYFTDVYSDIQKEHGSLYKKVKIRIAA